MLTSRLELVYHCPQAIIVFSDMDCLFYFFKGIPVCNNCREINCFLCCDSGSLGQYCRRRAKGSSDRDLVVVQPVSVQDKCLSAWHAGKDIYLRISASDQAKTASAPITLAFSILCGTLPTTAILELDNLLNSCR